MKNNTNLTNVKFRERNQYGVCQHFLIPFVWSTQNNIMALGIKIVFTMYRRVVINRGNEFLCCYNILLIVPTAAYASL